MTALHLGVAIGDDDQQSRARHVVGDEFEQLQRGRVGPLRVVEDDQQAGRLGDRAEEAADRVEQSKARLVGGPLRFRRSCGAAAQRREDVRQLAADLCGGLHCQFRPALPHPTLQSGVPGTKDRRGAVLPAVTPPHRSAACGSLGGGDRHQPCLADTGLAADQHDAAGAGDGIGQRLLQRIALRLAPDEGGARVGGVQGVDLHARHSNRGPMPVNRTGVAARWRLSRRRRRRR
jgi:hypothetical protein